MTSSEKLQVREDLISDMQSASTLIEGYEGALFRSDIKLSPETAMAMAGLIEFEQGLLLTARIKLNKLRRMGQI